MLQVKKLGSALNKHYINQKGKFYKIGSIMSFDEPAKIAKECYNVY